jgi:anti-anti-sigma regulatory factor
VLVPAKRPDDHDQRLALTEQPGRTSKKGRPMTNGTTDDDALAAVQDADPTEVECMFAQTASGLGLDDGRITPKGVSATTLFFSDRPERLTGHVPTGHFETMRWEYGHLKGTGNTDAHPVPGVIVYRFGAPLIFSNAEAFEAGAKNLLIEAGAKGDLPSTLVIDCEVITHFDSTGAASLTSTLEYAQRYGLELVLARLHSGARRLLELTGDLDEIGEQRIFDTLRNAVNAATAKG